MEDKIQEAIEAIEKLEVEPYPEDIFLPLSNDELAGIHAMLVGKFNMPLDRLSGHIGRILRKPIIEDAKALKEHLLSLQSSAPLQNKGAGVKDSVVNSVDELYRTLRVKDILPPLDAVNKRLLCEAIERYKSQSSVVKDDKLQQAMRLLRAACDSVPFNLADIEEFLKSVDESQSSVVNKVSDEEIEAMAEKEIKFEPLQPKEGEEEIDTKIRQLQANLYEHFTRVGYKKGYKAAIRDKLQLSVVKVSDEEKLEFMNSMITDMDDVTEEPTETFASRSDDRLIYVYNKYIKPLSQSSSVVKDGDVSLCDGCNVRGNWEHRCHGGNCSCNNPICMEYQGRITHEQLMEIVNKEASSESSSVKDEDNFQWTDNLVKDMIYSKLPIPAHYTHNLQKFLDEFKESRAKYNLQSKPLKDEVEVKHGIKGVIHYEVSEEEIQKEIENYKKNIKTEKSGLTVEEIRDLVIKGLIKHKAGLQSYINPEK